MVSKFGDGIAFVDGDFCPVAEARIPLLDWGFLRSDACQDTVSVWHGSFFRLEDHLDRFERSFTRLRLTCPHDRDRTREILTECVRRTGLRDAYLQMLMTRGRPLIGSRDLRQAKNNFFAFCVPYISIASPEQQRRGMHLVVSGIRRIPADAVDPTIKHYHWLDFEMGLLEAYDRGGESVVLVDEEGNVTEGPGFNLFGVIDGALVTPGAGCLDGLTRTTVFELCSETNLEYSLTQIPAKILGGMDEVFISSTAGGIMPVSIVDGQPIGDASPGPVTMRLRDLYWSKRQGGWHGTPIEYAPERD